MAGPSLQSCRYQTPSQRSRPSNLSTNTAALMLSTRKVDWKHMGIGLPSHASALDPCCQSGQAAKHNQLPLKLRVY
ncbi:hypothetical protein NQZ68_035967 [Dissostichus eleginoides]|nr:hypothetical protein NQZ68_035967 [Dissostichus eleginoides]